jgi:hypothetical protein
LHKRYNHPVKYFRAVHWSFLQYKIRSIPIPTMPTGWRPKCQAGLVWT